jgi:transposase
MQDLKLHVAILAAAKEVGQGGDLTGKLKLLSTWQVSRLCIRGEFRWWAQRPEFCGVWSMARPWSPLSVRLAFWKGLDEGLPASSAARAAGVSRATAYRWLGEDRQVLPSLPQNFAVTRPGSLSLREREEIGFQLARGQGVRQIAEQLGRAPSTISREVARKPGL